MDEKEKIIKKTLDTIFDEEFNKYAENQNNNQGAIYDNDVRRRKIATVVNKDNSKITFSSITSLIILLIFVSAFGVPIFLGGFTNKTKASVNEVLDLKYDCKISSNRNSNKASENCEIIGNKIVTKSILYNPSDIINYEVTITNSSDKKAILYNIFSLNNYTRDLLLKGDEVYLDNNGFLTAKYVIYYNDKEYIGDKTIKKSNIFIEPGESITVIIDHSWLNINENYSKSNYQIHYDVALKFKY